MYVAELHRRGLDVPGEPMLGATVEQITGNRIGEAKLVARGRTASRPDGLAAGA